jgi:CRISPR system Cascade subunit CasB
LIGSAPRESRAARFVTYLEQLAATEDRAALAALRRGLGKPPGEAAEAHRYVLPWLGTEARLGEEDAYYLVAALFGWHPQSWRPAANARRASNLGASLARLAHLTGSPSVKRRFVALLNCHRDDLAEHLRQVIGLLKTGEIPVDWARLLGDLQWWDRPERRVQREWARAFWGAPTTNDDGPTVEES